MVFHESKGGNKLVGAQYSLCRQHGFSRLKSWCCQGKFALQHMVANKRIGLQLDRFSTY